MVGDLAKPFLGCTVEEWAVLSEKIDAIYHAGGLKLDGDQPLRSLGECLALLFSVMGRKCVRNQGATSLSISQENTVPLRFHHFNASQRRKWS